MQALSDPRLKRATTLLAAIAVSGAALAGSTTQTYTHVSQLTSWTDNTTQSFAKFDPLLGTLTSVDFYLGGSMVTQVELNNKNVNAGSTVTNTTTGSYGIYGTGSDMSTYFTASSTPYSVTKDLKANNESGSTAYNDPHGYVDPQHSLAFTSTATSYTDAATLQRFTGPGSISLMFYASAFSNGSAVGGGNINVANITTASGSGYLRYNFTANPTPEPASFAALAIGAVALMRRRKAVAR